MTAVPAVLSLAPTWLMGTLLIAIRIGGLFVASAPFGLRAVPPMVRTALVFALAFTLASALPPSPPVAPDLGSLITAACLEFALGATMALGISLAFAAYAVGARLVDVQIGFGIGQVLDPLTRQQLPVLSGAFNQLALVMFFLADGHVHLLQGLAMSLERFPPGAPWPLDQAWASVMQGVTGMFVLGFAMVAPLVLALLLVDVAIGMLSRNLPQMNAFALSMPVKALVALAGLSVWLMSSSAILQRTHRAMFEGWEALFR